MVADLPQKPYRSIDVHANPLISFTNTVISADHVTQLQVDRSLDTRVKVWYAVTVLQHGRYSMYSKHKDGSLRKRYSTNADRQRAYRERKKLVQNVIPDVTFTQGWFHTDKDGVHSWAEDDKEGDTDYGDGTTRTYLHDPSNPATHKHGATETSEDKSRIGDNADEVRR